MKKRSYRPYRVTKSGIRIPKRKIKWMKPSDDEMFDEPELPAPADRTFADLYNRNMAFFLQSSQSSDPYDGGDCFED